MLVSGEKICGVLRCEIWFCAIKNHDIWQICQFSVLLLEIGLIKYCYVLSMLTTIYFNIYLWVILLLQVHYVNKIKFMLFSVLLFYDIVNKISLLLFLIKIYNNAINSINVTHMQYTIILT